MTRSFRNLTLAALALLGCGPAIPAPPGPSAPDSEQPTPGPTIPDAMIDVGGGKGPVSPQRPTGTRRAVVVGIDHYQKAHWSATKNPPLPVGREVDTFADLKGAVNDANSMVEVLVGRFGFERKDILVLRNLEATREKILESIQTWLIEPAKRGDTVVFYYSGHGSLIVNPAEADKTDETLVPADSVVGALDIRDDELAQLWNTLVFDKEAKLTVILDSCHSGGMSRGGRSKRIQAAKQPFSPVDLGDRRADSSENALFLAASQDFQEAKEADGTPAFGAFTSALLDALRDDPTQEAGKLMQRIQARLIGSNYAQRADIRGGRSRGRDLLGEPVKVRPLIFPVSYIHGNSVAEDSGRIELLGGSVLGLTVGSKLSVWDGRAPSGDWEVEVTRVELGRSFARQRTPNQVRLTPGTSLVVTEWMPGPNPLKVSIESGPTRGDLDKAAKEVAVLGTTKNVSLVPPEGGADYNLWYEAGTWRLQAGSGDYATKSLGRSLTATGVRNALQSLGYDQTKSVRIAVAFPPSDDLATKVRNEVERSGGVAIAPRGEAKYDLVGALESGRLVWYWARANGEQTPGSVEPRRTSGFPEGEKDLHIQLDQLVDKLAMIHGWMTLSSPAGLAGAGFPFELVFEDLKGQTVKATDLKAGNPYNAVLKRSSGAGGPTEPRYVYLLNIDSFGSGNFVFPETGNASANRCPRAENESRCLLRDDGRADTFQICTPGEDPDCVLGPEAFLLIVTREPLTDLSALNWTGVVSERARSKSVSCSGSIECLLASTGTRGTRRTSTTSAGWSIQKVFAHSAPN